MTLMKINLHPNLQVKELTIGQEKAPLLVIDNFIEQSDDLVHFAAQQKFAHNSQFYPGIRADVPQAYQQLILDKLTDTLIEYFQLGCQSLKFQLCQYSIVTTPANQLSILQRIPHFDSLDSSGLAAVHYLFKQDLGGTSFYRHKKTGFEYIDESRKIEYYRSLETENDGPNMPKLVHGYISGDTPLFERIAQKKGVFNRIIFYRRNSLHSGSISKDFIVDPDPLRGRLSINTFLDPE